MTSRNMARRPRSMIWRYLLLGVGLAACGGAVGVPTVGGESHFLRHCDEGCGKELTCVADLCTRGCVVAKDSCSDLNARATCTAASVEPGAVAVCDAPCEGDADCSSLGSAFDCQAGFCREQIPSGSAGATSGPEPGATGGASEPTTAGAAGAAGGGSEPGATFTPPARCLQPFDASTCDANFKVFAFDQGHCVEASWGGCEGNDNHFLTLEECLAVCEGRPDRNPCPEGRVAQQICISCGPAGGCGESIMACALPCTLQEECTGMATLGCALGVCQAYGCD